MDPLSLLREHHMGNKPVLLQGEQMVFGNMRIPRDTQTAYRSQAGGSQATQGAFYTIDQLWFFLQNSKLSHAQYLMACNKNKFKGVSLPDKRDLLAYLSGQTDHSAAIDLTIAPLLADMMANAGDQPPQKRHRTSEGARDALSEQQTHELLTEARRLVGAALDGPALVPVPSADGEAEAGASAADADAAAGVRPRVKPRKRSAPMPSGAALEALSKADLLEVDQITEQELRTASRSSLLLAPSKKVFATRLTQLVDALRERTAKPPPGSRALPPPGQPPRGAPPSDGKGGAKWGKAGLASQPPPLIIVVPASTSCKINMWNAADFLVRGVFVPTAEKRKDPANKKDVHVKHTHKLSTGLSLRFEIIDNVATLQESDWRRVVAVVAQGEQWQFKVSVCKYL